MIGLILKLKIEIIMSGSRSGEVFINLDEDNSNGAASNEISEEEDRSQNSQPWFDPDAK